MNIKNENNIIYQKLIDSVFPFFAALIFISFFIFILVLGVKYSFYIGIGQNINSTIEKYSYKINEKDIFEKYDFNNYLLINNFYNSIIKDFVDYKNTNELTSRQDERLDIIFINKKTIEVRNIDSDSCFYILKDYYSNYYEGIVGFSFNGKSHHSYINMNEDEIMSFCDNDMEYSTFSYTIT